MKVVSIIKKWAVESKRVAKNMREALRKFFLWAYSRITYSEATESIKEFAAICLDIISRSLKL